MCTSTELFSGKGGELLMEESMKDYEKELEASFRKISEGDLISGTVIDVNEEEVTLDLKYYAQGIIKAEDMSCLLYTSPEKESDLIIILVCLSRYLRISCRQQRKMPGSRRIPG